VQPDTDYIPLVFTLLTQFIEMGEALNLRASNDGILEHLMGGLGISTEVSSEGADHST